MAFLNPVGFLCYRHQSRLLFCKFSPVVVQVVGTVFASTSSDRPSKPSGPVRYVQKQLNSNVLDGSTKGALETRRKVWDPIQSNSSDEKNDGESNTSEKRRNSKTSRRTGSKSSGNSKLTTVVPAVVGKSTTRPDTIRKDGVEQGVQDTINFGLDPRESLFGDTTKTRTEDVQGGKKIGQISEKDPTTSARNYAMGLLGRGPQTEANLRNKMVRKNVPPEVIDEIISDLQRWGLQSDEEYAKAFARSRWADNTWGPKRIKFELMRRAIRAETVEAALVEVFQTSDAVDNQEEEDLGKWGMTTEAAEHLITQARRRWCQGDVKIEAKRRRMIGWLQRRGFPWSIIPDILKIIESEGTT